MPKTAKPAKRGRRPREIPREALTIRMEPEYADHYRKICEANQWSQSALMEHLIRNYAKTV